MTVVRNPVLRIVLMILGMLWVVIAFVGIFVPLIPSTGPIILAAFLFSKSSERFDHWLVNNKLFGSIVADWRTGVGFTIRMKTVAVVAVVASFAFSTIFVVTDPWLRIGLWSIAIGVAAFIVTRPTKPSKASSGLQAELNTTSH